MSETMCSRCSQSGMDGITCAFPGGVFTPHNWSCQTLRALREIAQNEQHYSYHYRHDDMSIAVLPIPESDDEQVRPGFVVMTWYKDRGRVTQAWTMSDDAQPAPLNLVTAEAVLR